MSRKPPGDRPTVSRPMSSVLAWRPAATSSSSPTSSVPSSRTSVTGPSGAVRGRPSRPDDARSGPHRDPQLGECGGEFGAGEGLLLGQQPVGLLDDGDLLGAQPAEGLGHLRADHPAAEHQQPARDLFGRGDVTVVPDGDVAQPVDRRDSRPGAGGHHDGPPGGEHRPCTVGRGDRDGPHAREPTLPADDVGADVDEPAGLRAVVPAAGERVAGGERLLDVHGAGDGTRRGRRPAGRGEGLAGAQQRLAGHAGPVRALPADQLALDHRGGQPVVAGVPGRVLPGRPAADDDDVVLLLVHGFSDSCAVLRCGRGVAVTGVNNRRCPQR